MEMESAALGGARAGGAGGCSRAVEAGGGMGVGGARCGREMG